MNATFTFDGRDPIAAIRELTAKAQPSEGDVLFALQRQRTRILKRTSSGVDAEFGVFTPYSRLYAKQKAKYRDPSTVDLRGRNAPHMLQQIVAVAGNLQDAAQQMFIDSPASCYEASLAFFDDSAALKARVHNEGEGRMPRRHFFDATSEDITAMENDIGMRIEARLNGQQ